MKLKRNTIGDTAFQLGSYSDFTCYVQYFVRDPIRRKFSN